MLAIFLFSCVLLLTREVIEDMRTLGRGRRPKFVAYRRVRVRFVEIIRHLETWTSTRTRRDSNSTERIRRARNARNPGLQGTPLCPRLNAQRALGVCSDVVDGGRMTLSPALRGETDHLDLPRLAFVHTRRDWGRMRQLLDRINELP